MDTTHGRLGILLAGGRGTRLGAGVPKALAAFAGKKNLRLLLTGRMPDARADQWKENLADVERVADVDGAVIVQTDDVTGVRHFDGLAVAADGSLVVVDQHAAHERVLYEAFNSQRAAAEVASQALLEPMAVDLPPRDTPYGVDEVLAAVASLHPAIEVPDSRYEDFTIVGAGGTAARTTQTVVVVLAVSSTAGYLAGVWLLRRAPDKWLRIGVVVLGVALTIGLFVRPV